MKRSHLWLTMAFVLLVATYSPLTQVLGGSATRALRYAVCLLIVLRWFPALVQTSPSRLGAWSLGLSALAAVSLLWTPLPTTTALATFDLLLVTAAALCIGGSQAPHTVLRVLAHAGVIVLIASLGMMFLQPATQLDEYGRSNWVGIFSNPNEFGRQSLVTAVLCAALIPRGRRFALPAAAAAATALITGSAQVIIVGVVAALTLIATRTLRRSRATRGLFTLLIIGSGALSVYVTAGSRGAILSALGKDPTLTNRVPIWHSVIGTLDGKWLTGYGYGAYWRDPWVMSQTASADTRPPQQAHNSALELAAQAGVLAVVIVVIVLAKALRDAYRRLDEAPLAASALISCVITFLTYSITAAIFGRTPEQIYWVILVMLGTSISTVGAERASKDPTPTSSARGTVGRSSSPASNLEASTHASDT